MRSTLSCDSRSACRLAAVFLLSVACALVGAVEIGALDPSKAVTQYTIRAWRTSDGLPQNAVTALTQTVDGFLWVGTQAGLARFDGVEFRIFDETSVDALEDHFISALAADPDGSLWIGTRSGLVHYSDGVFRRLTTADGLPHDYIRSLHLGLSGRLWIGTYGGGVTWRSPGTERLSEADSENWPTIDSSDGLPDDVVRTLFEDRDGSLWIGTANGLSRWRDDEMTTWTESDGLAANFVRSITADAEGGLWVASHDGGLQRFSEGRFHPREDQGGRAEQTIWAVTVDRHGSLWSATRGGGLLRRVDGRFSVLDTNDGLPSDEIFSLFQDREATLWVGTRQGLVQLKDGRVTTYREAEGLSHRSVRTILETSSGELLVGTSGGGLDRLLGESLSPAVSAAALPTRRIRSLIERDDGSLWIGTDQGLTRLIRAAGSTSDRSPSDGETGASWSVDRSWSAPQSLPHNRINALAEDSTGRLWVGMGGGGLCRFESERCRPLAAELPNPVVRSLLAAADELWIGTEDGLSKLSTGTMDSSDPEASNEDGERLRTWTEADGLPSGIVLSLYLDDDGVLWVGTGDGLARFKNERFEALTPADGLVGDTVFNILEDDRGFLWLSGDKGLSRVSKAQIDRYLAGEIDVLEFRRFDEADGMASSECNGGTQPAGWKSRDGRLWLPTINGLVTVDPRLVRVGLLPPPVVIDKVEIDGRTFNPRPARNETLSGDEEAERFAGIDRVEIPADSRRFEIQYTAPSFIAPKKTRFRYRLEGFDDDWIEAGNRRTAFYTNIPSGSFRFQVAASSEGGEWATEASDLALFRRPGPFESAWFYGLAALGLVVAGFAVARFRSRALRQRQGVLERVVDERTHELAEANRALAQMVSVDSMTGIANHRKLQEALDREWRRGVRSGWPLSVVMIDIDFFKNYNDTYGHLAGDRCLERVASALDDTVRRPGDLVARYGGEEFVALLPRTDREGALAISESFRRVVEALRIEHASSAVSDVVTVSLGVATSVPQAGAESGELIGEADRALYRAKGAGRNQVV